MSIPNREKSKCNGLGNKYTWGIIGNTRKQGNWSSGRQVADNDCVGVHVWV